MPTIPQARWTALFRALSATVSSLARYREAKDLIGGFGFFAFIRRDEFGFFPDPVAALRGLELRQLLRGVAYSLDDVLRFQVTAGLAGAFTLKVVLADGTVVANASGTFGTPAALSPAVPKGPTGTILVSAPVGAPPADAPVDVLIAPSSIAQVFGEVAETDAGLESAAVAIEAHRISAGNLTGTLFEDTRDAVLTQKFLPRVVGQFIGSTTVEAFVEDLEQAFNGAVSPRVRGLLVELDQLMRDNVPAQTVQRSAVSIGPAAFVGSGQGTLAAAPFEGEPPKSRVVLRCVRGFSDAGEVDDPEQFSVVFLDHDSPLLNPVHPLTIYQPYKLRSFALSLELRRKVTHTEQFGQLSNVDIRRVHVGRLPGKKLRGKLEIIGPGTGHLSFFLPGQEASPLVVFGTNFPPPQPPFDSGHFRAELPNGLLLSFDWAHNPAATTHTFDVDVFPFERGDTVSFSVANDGAGRLQAELRRLYGFTFSQHSPAPTLPDMVAPALPFVRGPAVP